MALANVVTPPSRQDSGTTSNNNITWTRYGNVVEVDIYGLYLPNTNTEVTGLPKPKKGYAIFKPSSSQNILGWLEYDANQKWMLGKYSTSSSGGCYGTYTYICDDNE